MVVDPVPVLQQPLLLPQLLHARHPVLGSLEGAITFTEIDAEKHAVERMGSAEHSLIVVSIV